MRKDHPDPDNSGRKQDRTPTGQFKPGISGNPAGRPPGRRNHASELFDEVVNDDRFRLIVSKAATLAEEGNTACINTVLKLRVPAPRDIDVMQPVNLPSIETAADALAALRVIAEAAARAEIDADHARILTTIVMAFIETLKVVDLDARLREVETHQSDSP